LATANQSSSATVSAAAAPVVVKRTKPFENGAQITHRGKQQQETDDVAAAAMAAAAAASAASAERYSLRTYNTRTPINYNIYTLIYISLRER
jgi:hypothetical protein